MYHPYMGTMYLPPKKITAYFCEKCHYLFACDDGKMKFCIKCNEACFLGKENYEKKVRGFCPECLSEGGGL